MNQGESMLARRIAAWALVFAVTWGLGNLSDLQAGQIYYYDTQGNLISEEAYRKLIQKMNGAPDTSSSAAEASGGDIPAADQETSDRADQQVESQNEAEEHEEDEAGDARYQAKVSSETLLGTFERDTGKNKDAMVVPAYQYLRFDLGALDQGGLSLHMYGWGRYDLNTSGFYQDNPDGELLYGYLEYNRPDYGLNFKLGRQHVMTGVINNSLDGLGVQSTMTPYLKFSAYGGSPVELSAESGRTGDRIWGGRIAGHRGTDYEVGFSYKSQTSDGEDDQELAGIDLFAQLPLNISFFGFSSYNLDTRGWGQHLYELRFDIGDFGFRPFYQRYQYEDFFSTQDSSVNPFRFLADTGEILSVLGSDVTWYRFNQVDLGAKFNYYDYDLREDGAYYLEANANWHINGFTRLGGQLGRMDGDTTETSYLLTRAFFYWNLPSILSRLAFITGDAMLVNYDEAIYGQDYSLWFSLGGGLNFFEDALKIKLSANWSHDPYLDSDLGGLLKIEYTY